VIASSDSERDLPSGKLARNVLHFGRLLRRAGLPVGTGQILDAVRATAAIDLARREDLYWALHAVFVTRVDQRTVFQEAFQSYWRDPFGAEAAWSTLLPTSRVPSSASERPAGRRIEDAWRRRDAGAPPNRHDSDREDRMDVDVVMTYSAEERLRHRDFERMSADEMARARQLMKKMRLPFKDARTRRMSPDPSGGRVDMRRTLKAALRSGGGSIPLRWRSVVTRPPPIVVLCDISGSMERYARMLLHFIHALGSHRDRVQTFLFGTRLWYATRAMRHRDVDEALARLGEEVDDWSGGTRIGACLADFNRHWGRRVLGQGAVVLLVSDGLDRGDRHGLDQLEMEMDRLHRSCRKLLWLNPLLRYDGFQPRAAGIRAMLPHVDLHLPVHNLESLDRLVAVLSGTARGVRGSLVSHTKARHARRSWTL
jgi:uncharacterized protein with von Willebrand factor type A (vWA) domain